MSVQVNDGAVLSFLVLIDLMSSRFVMLHIDEACATSSQGTILNNDAPQITQTNIESPDTKLKGNCAFIGVVSYDSSRWTE